MEKQDVATKKVILIVDDDKTLLELYERMFGAHGVEAVIAKDGQEGIEMVRSHRPDFVILDIRMPKVDGIRVLEMIRKEEGLKDTPVLILTNYGEEEYREATKKLGIVDFVVKTDIDPTALVRRVVDLISRRQ